MVDLPLGKFLRIIVDALAEIKQQAMSLRVRVNTSQEVNRRLRQVDSTTLTTSFRRHAVISQITKVWL